LHFAAKAGHQEVVEILLRAGAHVDVRMSGRGKLTPFHLAVGSGHSEITARLIAAGADVDEIVEIGGKRFNALGLATEKGHREIIQVLLASGAGSSMYRKRRWSIDAVFNSLEYLSENED
jgi:ankyrin repeat protein